MDLSEIKTILPKTWRVNRFHDGAWEAAVTDGDMRKCRHMLEEILSSHE